MKVSIRRFSPVFAAIPAAIVVAGLCISPALAQQQTVHVVVNGQPMTFDQPPVQQAGRVFVPLRGVFERLGATVVYANGIINATGGGRAISLHLGSTQATIDGQPQSLDVAPFMIGARTLVPLRFVAQALGATVNWNQASSTVSIFGAQGGSGPPTPPPPVPQPPGQLALSGYRPIGNISTLYPAIHAEFAQPVRPETLHVTVDGADVTANVYMNARGFDLTSPTPLAPGAHHVRVNAVSVEGYPVRGGWSFYTTPAQAENFLNGFTPSDFVFVNRPYTLYGRTLPYARIHAVATQRSGGIAGLFLVDTNTYQTDVVANADGVFSVNLDPAFVNSSPVRLVIQSIAPSGASTEQQLTLRF